SRPRVARAIGGFGCLGVQRRRLLQRLLVAPDICEAGKRGRELTIVLYAAGELDAGGGVHLRRLDVPRHGRERGRAAECLRAAGGELGTAARQRALEPRTPF